MSKAKKRRRSTIRRPTQRSHNGSDRISPEFVAIGRRCWTARSELEANNLLSCVRFAGAVQRIGENTSIERIAWELVADAEEALALCVELAAVFGANAQPSQPDVGTLQERLAISAPGMTAMLIAIADFGISTSLSCGILKDAAEQCRKPKVQKRLRRIVQVFERRSEVGWGYVEARLPRFRFPYKVAAKRALAQCLGDLPTNVHLGSAILVDTAEPRHAAIGHTTLRRQAALAPGLYVSILAKLGELGLA